VRLRGFRECQLAVAVQGVKVCQGEAEVEGCSQGFEKSETIRGKASETIQNDIYALVVRT